MNNSHGELLCAGVTDLGACLKACCDDHACNAIFHTDDNNCLTIQCKSDEACAPGVPSASHGKAILINLRTVGKSICSTFCIIGVCYLYLSLYYAR